jgi:hypothetical protein
MGQTTEELRKNLIPQPNIILVFLKKSKIILRPGNPVFPMINPVFSIINKFQKKLKNTS